jgi:hypothetical protein
LSDAFSDAFGDALVAHRLFGRETFFFLTEKHRGSVKKSEIELKMTVETTSFLSGAKITANGSEKSAKFLKNHKNLIIFLFAVILLLFCVSASVLQVRSTIFPHVFLFLAFLREKIFLGESCGFSFYWHEKRFFLYETVFRTL